MMSDVVPSNVELARAVREHLDRHVIGRLTGKDAYELRIAANLLAILQREIEQGPDLEARELSRLTRLLGSEGDLEELNARLADRIREGDLDAANQELMTHLRSTVCGRLGIDNPKYSAYRRATSRDSGGAT